MGKVDQARPDVDLILRQAPRMAIAIYYRAIILARSNQLAAAWSVVHVLPSEFIQGNAEIAMNVASMALAAGFLDSAATILNKAVFNNPSALEARLKLVELRLRQKSPQYALNALAVVEDSKDPRVALSFAQVYLKIGRRADAQKYVDRAISLGGGESLAMLGKTIALKSLLDWRRRHPDDLVAHKQYAILLLRYGDLANAKIQYEQLVLEQPTDGLSLNNLSWLVVKDDPRRALALAARAAKQNPNSPDYLDTLGCMQMNRSDFKSALDSLKRAHGLRPGDAEISYHLVLAMDATGAHAEAKALLATAVARGGFPELEIAKKLLATWR
jgi:tetratricopeptide (TPR) repeat protein